MVDKVARALRFPQFSRGAVAPSEPVATSCISWFRPGVYPSGTDFAAVVFGVNRKMGTRFRGFTLIELLVVITIIAILAAILFPVFARVKEKAKEINCVSNMRQVGLAVAMYTSDSEDILPITWLWDRDWCERNASWKQLIQPYQKSDLVFMCPSFSGPRVDCGQRVSDPQIRWLGEFGINNWAYIDRFTRVNPNHYDYKANKSASVYGIDLPSQTLIVGENDDGDWISEPENMKCTDPASAITIFTADYGHIAFRHGAKDKATAAFVDGHAKVLTRDQFHENNCYLWWRHKPE
jgi:prepilin-type N-terminal cleavage/methylation domain-containing protein/prepilin-type processing-associated H-X9-DG protein